MRLYAAGSNSEGQLGVGHTDDMASWTPCEQDDGCAFPPPGWDIQACVCTSSATWALCTHADASARSLYVCGRTAHATYRAFTRVPCKAIGIDAGPGDAQVTMLAASWDCVYIVVRGPEADDIYAYGGSAWGEAGPAHEPGAYATRIPLQIETVAYTSTPLSCESLAQASVRIRAVQAGVRHVVLHVVWESTASHAIVCHGILGWGHARHGQLGPPPPPSSRGMYTRPIAVCLWPPTKSDTTVYLAAGMQHTVLAWATPAHTELWALGQARDGQLALPFPRSDVCPAWAHRFDVDGPAMPLCQWKTTFVWAGAALHACGRASHEQTSGTSLSMAHAQAMAAGSEHCLVRTASGDVYGWGWNEHGNLAHSPDAAALVPRRVWDHRADAGRAQRMWAGNGTSFLVV